MTEHALIKFILQLSSHYIWNTNTYFIAPPPCSTEEKAKTISDLDWVCSSPAMLAKTHEQELLPKYLAAPKLSIAAKRGKFYITVINFAVRVHLSVRCLAWVKNENVEF